MELAGFCRNCLSRWYREAAEERGIELEDAEAREIVYGMPYGEWKSRYQASRPRGLRRAAAARRRRALRRGCRLRQRARRRADAPTRRTSRRRSCSRPEAAREGRAQQGDEEPQRKSKAQVVQLQGVGADRLPPASPADDAPSPGAPTDAEVRAELRQARAALASFRKHLNSHGLPADGAEGACAGRRHRGRAGQRAGGGQARDPRGERDREVPLQVGRRPRRVARQRLRLLGLRVLRARGRRPARTPAHLGRCS